MDTVVQELCLVFFAQEVLQGERALEDARARLAALWDKLVELATERDQARLVANIFGQGRCVLHLDVRWKPLI